MDLLNFDIIEIKKRIPYIMDAFAEVYGKEYTELIKQRENRNCYIIYKDADGINNYISFLEDCKAKELSIKFLERIGIDISEFKQESYAKELDENLSKLIEIYLGDYRNIKPIESLLSSKGINAWSSIGENTKFDNLKEKIEFLNYLRGKDEKTITEENYEDFCNTEEYNKILIQIKKDQEMLEEITQEYEEYKKELKPYSEYVEDETDRKNKIKEEITKRKNKELYEKVRTLLPSNLRDIIDKDINANIYLINLVEAFSSKKENVLNKPNEIDNLVTYSDRIKYFEQMSVISSQKLLELKEIRSINARQLVENGTLKSFYEELIQQEDIKELIIPPKVADEIAKISEKIEKETREDINKEYIYGNEDFENNANLFTSKEKFYKDICGRKSTKGMACQANTIRI